MKTTKVPPVYPLPPDPPKTYPKLVDIPTLILGLDPEAGCTPDGMRLMGALAVVAAYEKRAQPEFFIDMLEHYRDTCTAVAYLQAGCAVGSVLCNMQDEKHPNGPEALDRAVAGVLHQIKAIRVHFIKKLKLLDQIPEGKRTLS